VARKDLEDLLTVRGSVRALPNQDVKIQRLRTRPGRRDEAAEGDAIAAARSSPRSIRSRSTINASSRPRRSTRRRPRSRTRGSTWRAPRSSSSGASPPARKSRTRGRSRPRRRRRSSRRRPRSTPPTGSSTARRSSRPSPPCRPAPDQRRRSRWMAPRHSRCSRSRTSIRWSSRPVCREAGVARASGAARHGPDRRVSRSILCGGGRRDGAFGRSGDQHGARRASACATPIVCSRSACTRKRASSSASASRP